MTIHLTNEYSSCNLGDAIIYETLAQLCAPSDVFSSLPEGLARNARGLSRAPDRCDGDVHISVGGDIFNNARPWLVTRRFIQNVWDLAKCPPERTFLFGQSIPQSCRGAALIGLSMVLKRLSSVTVRDLHSHHRLRKLGVKAQLSHDIAFAYRIGSGAGAAGQALFDSAGLDAQRCVLMSIREFDQMYPVHNQRFLTRMAELAQGLISRGHQVAVLIQADSLGADSDLKMARALQHLVPSLAVLCPFSSPGHHPVDAMVGAIALANGVVAVRYHTAILRLLSGRQPYNLHYSIKGQDLSRRLGVGGAGLADFNPAQAILDIEASMDLAHDPSPQTRHVRDSFLSSLMAARSAQPLPRHGVPHEAAHRDRNARA